MATNRKPTVTPSIPPKDEESVVLERKSLRVEPPKMYRVLLLNDDFTPMEFVVMILQEFFNKDRQLAAHIMLQVHMEGRGVCGIYTKDIAITKVEQVVASARHAGHPLQCIYEPVV